MATQYNLITNNNPVLNYESWFPTCDTRHDSEEKQELRHDMVCLLANLQHTYMYVAFRHYGVQYYMYNLFKESETKLLCSPSKPR